MLDRLISEILLELEENRETWADRYNTFWGYNRKEDNIFSLASALFILQEVKTKFTHEQLKKLDKIGNIITNRYLSYKNKDDRATYNFYSTKPSKHFPNGGLMQHFDHFRLPDDIDDTALVYFTSKFPKKEVEQLKTLTESFSQTFSDGSTVYNTWYGKNMPKEQDVCAILNLFYLFHTHNLPLSKVDKDSFGFLIKSIDKIDSKPFEIARHYAHPALIVYHYARFMSKFPSVLDDAKSEIIKIAYSLLEKEGVFMNRLILSTSLLKLGERPKEIDLKKLNFKDFYTFIGAPFAPFSNTLFQKLAGKSTFQMFWKSDIHNKALVLEYLVQIDK